MRRITLIILAVAAILAGSVSCKKANDIDKEPLSTVALSIIPDFSDGSVYSYSDDGSFFLRVGVTPEEYLDKFGNDGKYIYRADFRKVITKASPEETDFSVIGEISSTSVEEGCLTASFMLTEDEMEKMWDADYVVSFAVKAKDGSDGFMTAFVPVSWYLRDGSGGDEEIFEVGGHKVTMKIADGIDSKDILTRSFVDGDKVIIKAISFQDMILVCKLEGDAQCERTITNGKFTFTISEISSDIEAVLGYAPVITLTVTSDSNGKVWIGDDKNKTNGQFEQGEQVVIHATPNDNFRFFRWDDNDKESSRTITVGATDVTYSAKFISIDMIPGLFTVDSNGKQVFFSKGNLYCCGVEFNDDGTVKSMANAQWGFEANQYDTTPSSIGDRVKDHISHFMWCADATNAMALKYEDGEDGWNKDETFFAAKNFTVNGYSGWGVLTGGTNGEWAYLLNTRKTIYGKDTDVENRCYAAVKVNGMAGLLIFPDDFSSWPSKDAGIEPQTFNTYSSNWNERNYTIDQFNTLQKNGCVFLPAAGCRTGNPGIPNPARVGSVGLIGYYWSASPYVNINVYDLYFNGDNVRPSDRGSRERVLSVRLVTEVK